MVSFDINTPDRVCIDRAGNGLELHNTKTAVGMLCVRDGYRVADLWRGSPRDEVFVEEVPPLDERMEIHPALEGTELRLFHHSGKWRLSTAKKLDAFASYWGSPLSHGNIFVAALRIQYGLSYKEFLLRMDKANIYVFFLRNYCRNRVVCLGGPYPDVYHTGTYPLAGSGPVTRARGPHFGVRRLPRILSFGGAASESDILEHVRDSDPLLSAGVLIVTKTRRIKVCSKRYTEMERIRGNDPCMVKRYLSAKGADGDRLLDLYPEHAALFADVESRMGRLVQSLAGEYFRMYEDDAHPAGDPPVLGEISEHVLRCVRRRAVLGGGVASLADIRSIVRAEVAKLGPDRIYKIL